jgi:DNA processing protein
VSSVGPETAVEQIVEGANSDFRNTKFASRLRELVANCEIDQILSSAATANLEFITPDDACWPIALSDLDDTMPLGLWIRGNLDLAAITDKSVAIVGARASTDYGQRMASDLASHLSAHELTVVSGAAFGIDAAAHRGALAIDCPTVAVLACGADQVYPAAHQALLERIAEQGLVISEAPPGARAAKHLFLIRNRLIAALTGATVVIEAALRSGSLSTSMWAHSLGRQVWGVPGPVTSPASAGVHAAIRDQVMDILLEPAEVIKFFSDKP